MSMLGRARVGLTRVLASSLSQGELASAVPELERISALSAALQASKDAAAAASAEQKALRAETQSNAVLAEQLAAAQAQVEELRAEAMIAQVDARAASKEQRRVEEHPLYGRLLHDFGYKKVYASEPARLCNKALLKAWEQQRVFRVERAQAMAKFKAQDARFGFPGVITLFDQDHFDKRGIVDGQHRIGALELMRRDGSWADDQLILTEVYDVASDDDGPVRDLFVEINQAQPVLEVDLPGSDDKENLKNAITAAVAQLAAENPHMFKPSARCRPPHLNEDVFRQTLFESDRAREIVEGKSAEEAQEAMLAWVVGVNEGMGERSDEEWMSSQLLRVKKQSALETALAKSKKHDFFLGLDLSWT